MGALIAPEEGRGVAVGFYSCPFANCIAGQSARSARGASGDVYLGAVRVTGDKPGQLEIKFDAFKFVNAKGNPVSVTIPTTSVVVQVGAGGPRYPAPSGN